MEVAGERPRVGGLCEDGTVRSRRFGPPELTTGRSLPRDSRRSALPSNHGSVTPLNELTSRPSVGIVGFGAFGQLMARHLAPHFPLRVYDPSLPTSGTVGNLRIPAVDLIAVASCPVVVLAAPVSSFEEVIRTISPHLGRGAVVLDVGSVKAIPAEIMRRHLPAHIGIVGTHPLFGPQSARDGIHGLKIAVCLIRGRHGLRVAAFLRKILGLNVIITTPEAHDRELAVVQGLTHLIAKVLVRMESQPLRMTTRSFDMLTQAVEMVRHDGSTVQNAIQQWNPYAHEVRCQFFNVVAALEAELGGTRHTGQVDWRNRRA